MRAELEILANFSLEDELAGVLAQNGISDRDRRVYSYRYGWDGNGPHTLQETGDLFGVTRERVRQIGARVAGRVGAAPYFLPKLDRTIALLAGASPARGSDLVWAILRRGLSNRAFNLSGVSHAARTLGRAIAFESRDIEGELYWGSSDDLDILERARRTARRLSRRWGASTVYEVSLEADEHGSDTDIGNTIADFLSRTEEFRWLDSASGWFWYVDTTRNRLVNQIRKVLSVNSRVSVGDLRVGISRHYRMKGFAPPRRVLLELCRQLPGVQVEGDWIWAVPALDPSRVLGRTEAVLAEILMRNGGIMPRERFEDECVARGMNRATFYVYLDYSPILSRYSRGVYGLCGAVVNPGTVEALAPTRRRGKVLLDYGWDDTGAIWLAYRLSESMINSGVFYVPSSLKSFVDGEFVLMTHDGSIAGTVISSSTGAWGLGPFFRRRGGEPGDYLLLTVDLERRRVTASLGDLDAIEARQESCQGTG